MIKHHEMKIKKNIQIVFFSSLILFAFKPCFSQLTVDAGKDTTYCVGLYASTMYLESATIEGGIEPYTIAWECKVPKGSYSYYTASDLLNDTTVLEPQIRSTFGGKIKYVLNVTDSENNYAKDSIYVRFSSYIYLTGYHVYEVNKGDSVLFYDSPIIGGIGPLTYHWEPTIGLTNPDTLVTWCKTDSLTEWWTAYDVVATDSCGCASDPNRGYEVRINPTGAEELELGIVNGLNIRQEGTKIYFNNPHRLWLFRFVLCHRFRSGLCQ